MTPSGLLADLYRQGVEFRVVGDRLGLRAPGGTLAPSVRAAVIHHKPQLMQLLTFAEEYRTLLRDLFSSLPEGPAPDDGDEFLDEQVRLTDELGPELAGAIAQMTARAWRDETDICPLCVRECTCQESPAE